MSVSLSGGGVSAPDAGEARTYRQHVLAGRWPIQIGILLEIAWLVVGAIVLRQLTFPGPDRFARTILGLAIWIGPLVVIALPLNLGRKGRLRDWWWPRLIVRVDDGGLAWWTEGSVRRPEDAIAWSAVGSVHPTLPTRNRPPGADCALAASDGRVLARLPCRLVRIDRPVSRANRWRRVAWLPDIAVAVRPDRYRRRRVLGRRATLRDPAAESTA
jgi:hypothetical protein